MDSSIQLRGVRARARGVTLVWVAIVIVVLIGFVALAVDWGYAYYTTQKLQNAADAAALAGAQTVWDSHDEARERAMNFSSYNEAGGDAVLLDENASNDPAGDIVTGVYDSATRVFTPSDEEGVANAVRVNARRTADSPNGPLALVWGRIFGFNSTQFSRWAIAVAEGGPRYADIIALNDRDPQSFYIYGNGYLDVGDGAVQVNSSHVDGTTFQGTQLTFIAGEVDMVGPEFETRGKPELSQIEMNTEQPYVPDPLASLPEPTPGAPMFPPSISGTAEYYPGYYPGGLYLNNGESAFLHPGVYILDTGFHTNGHSSLTGHGVTFFIRSGELDHNGTGEMRVTPPADGAYKGIQFFQARSNTEEAHFNGTGLFTGAESDDPSTPDVDESTAGAGTLYFPNATVHLNGTGDMFFNGLIADKIHVGGDGRKTVTRGWDGDDGGDKVYLVE
ncbi:MAG: TadE family protein [Tepidisphaeraceae bacterium]